MTTQSLSERIKARDRARGRLLHRKIAVKERYAKAMATEDGRARILATKTRWRERNRIKRKCHILVGNAIKYGKLVPKPCERCGEEAQAHHEDYSKPFEIMWLCNEHHGERHREINERKRHEKPT